MTLFNLLYRLLQHNFCKILLVIALTVNISSCSPGNHSTQKAQYHQPSSQKISVEQRFRLFTNDWYGTPYKIGGTSRNGVDCSGFVMTAYRDLFAVRLPRTTKAQVKAGVSIVQDQLQPGDLVFFRPPYKTRHVGIYLGSGEFAHASVSQGVMVSHLSNDYWRGAYWTARRVL